MKEMKPWYLSKTIWGGLVAIGASVGALVGAPVTVGDQQVLTEALLQFVGAGGAVLAVIGRLAARQRIF